MTLATRNNVLLIGIVLSVAILGICAYITVFVLLHGYDSANTSLQYSLQWLLFRWKTHHMTLGWTFIGTGTLCLSSSVGAILLRRYFLKTSAPDIFFFTLFVITLSIGGLKSFEAYFLYLNSPAFYGVVITRVVYFGEFLGSFCLLASSLYAVGVQYQKYATVLGIASLVSFAVAYVVPVDSLSLYANFLYHVGNEVTIDAILLLTAVLTILSYVITIGRSADRAVIALSIVLSIIGRALLFYQSNVSFVLAGGLSLIGGITLYGTRNYRLHLWM